MAGSHASTTRLLTKNKSFLGRYLLGRPSSIKNATAIAKAESSKAEREPDADADGAAKERQRLVAQNHLYQTLVCEPNRPQPQSIRVKDTAKYS
jgi:hypothetical protein